MVALIALLIACGGKPVPTEGPGEPEPAGGQEEVAEAGPTTAACKPGTPATWDACDGVTMDVVGKVSHEISNHPTDGGGPMGFPGEEAPPPRVESYMDVGGVQIVVISAEPPPCTDGMTATGTITLVDLGGAPGTPNEYRGLRLNATKFACK